MKERPILFSAPMVNAILAGTKTMTRRVITRLLKVVPGEQRREGPCPYGVPGDRLWVRERMQVAALDIIDSKARRAQVRYLADETIGADGFQGTRSEWLPYPERLAAPKMGKCLAYGGYREASRIDLEVTAIRVERLQDITEEDARAEGVTRENVPAMLHGDPALARQAAIAIYGEEAVSRSTVDRRVWPIARNDRDLFMLAWTAINGKRAPWASNPWVWCVSFKRVRP